MGFLVALAPWMVHNVMRGHSPIFSLFWFEAMSGTDAWPGDSVWRSMSAASTNPLGFVFTHPLQMARKITKILIDHFDDVVIEFHSDHGILFKN